MDARWRPAHKQEKTAAARPEGGGRLAAAAAPPRLRQATAGSTQIKMNSTDSSYWQEQQLMDAMVRGLKHKAKVGGSTGSESDGSVSPTSSYAGSEDSDDRVRDWLDVRLISPHPSTHLAVACAS